MNNPSKPNQHQLINGSRFRALPSLEDVITSRPVERGIYVTSGSYDTLRRVEGRVVNLLANELQNSELSAQNPFYPTMRKNRRPSHIGKIVWVDSGNTFDAYHMASQARRRGLDPARILRAIQLGRPFTAFQYQQMLEQIPSAALFKGGSPVPSPFRERARVRETEAISEQVPHGIWWTPLVVISDLMGLFYDPELQDGDMVRAFREFLVRLAYLRERAIVLAVLVDHVVPPHRKYLLQEVMKFTRPLARPVERVASLEANVGRLESRSFNFVN